MRENYTPNAQEAIRLAKSASKHSKQNYTGTEHLLLGLQRVLTRKGRVTVIKNPKEEVGTEVKEEAWHKSEL